MQKKKLSERKVLVVPGQGQEQPNSMMMPPAPDGQSGDPGMMDPSMQGDGGIPDDMGDDGSMPEDDGGDMPEDNGDGSSQFDTNFDAGVEADEDEDPKKYIQQLTGKLSQSIRKYNKSQAVPDADLSKYVVGMIAKQATQGLSDDEVNKVLKKVTNAKDKNDDEGESANESIQRRNRKIDEIFNELVGDQEDTEKPVDKKQRKSFTKKPFTSPKFN